MLTPGQIRCARALLNWTVQDLAQRSDIAAPTITNIETGKTSPNTRTIEKLRATFEDAGLMFTARGGVDMAEQITTIKGENWYAQLLDNVINTLAHERHKQLLIEFSDDRKSPPAIVQMYRDMRAAGIKMRQLVEFGNDYLQGPVEEYRWIPKENFKNWVVLVYGDKVAVSIENESGCVIINDKDLAAAERNKFDLMWSFLPKPTASTADERF